MAHPSNQSSGTDPSVSKSLPLVPSKRSESGISLFFYKDKDGTPNVLFKWGDKADELIGGNGFSNIQMKIILNQHLRSTSTPVYIKKITLELIRQLSYATETSDEVLKEARHKRSSQQQLRKIIRSQNAHTSPPNNEKGVI